MRRSVVVIAAISLALGILLGKGGVGAVKNVFRSIKSVSVGTPFKTGEIFILSDFESDKELGRWKARSARIGRSTEHATGGSYSGLMAFEGRVQVSNVLMEDFFEGNPGYGNWTQFRELKFTIYNAEDQTERLILKIKDANDRSWQKNLYLSAGQSQETTIYIDELKSSLNPAAVRQFNFFRWEPGNDAQFYIDDIRLVPEMVKEETARSIKQESVSKGREHLADAAGGTFSEKGEGLQCASTTSMEKVFLEPSRFKGKSTDTIEISLARNEYESAQLVLYSPIGLENMSVEKSDLKSASDGKEFTIDKTNIKCFVVGYVRTKRPGYSVPHVGWWPDPLEEKPKFHIERNGLQPIWIEVYAPLDTPSGEYSGAITIKSGSSPLKEVKLKVKVWDFTLPKETHLKTAFDFYDGRLRRMYPKKNNQTQEDYGAMIEELKTRYYLDMIGHRLMPIFNFEIQDAFFARDIKRYLEAGLNNFAIGKFGGSFDNNWPKEPKGLEELLLTYKDYASVLRAANLIDRAYIYTYDEPRFGDPHAEMVTKMIHKADPRLRNMVCFHSPVESAGLGEWGEDIDIWCVRNAVFNEATAQKLLDKGKEVWLYVSGPEPPFPNLVIDYPAMAYRIIPWMCFKYGVTGYLYWCVNFWDQNPWQNPMNTKWEQNGNGLLYYPGEAGPVASIRLEVTRDGIEDYEYLYLLREKIEQAKRSRGISQQQLASFEKLIDVDASIAGSMSYYTQDPAVINERRARIAEAIKSLDKMEPLAQESQNAYLSEKETVSVQFNEPLEVSSAKTFGPQGAFTFETYRGGAFVIDAASGYALQKSDSYRDVSLIRSSRPLGSTYTITAIVGEIDYDLSDIEGLRPDPAYEEGPMDENGVYLLAIADKEPSGHHANDWWHEHRKVCIDVDNNVWGSGMPNPIFMVYFDKSNRLMAYQGATDMWQSKWDKAVTYSPSGWYKIEIKKTELEYVLAVYDDKGVLLKQAVVALSKVWNATNTPDYLVMGDPHENYYQGAMKIREIEIRE